MNNKDNTYKPGDFLGIEELAAFLKIKKSTAYKLSSNGKIPRFKPGGKKVLFLYRDVCEYLDKNRYKSQEELELDAKQIMSIKHDEEKS